MEASPFLNSITSYMYARRYAKRTIETYTTWIRRCIVYHGKKHPCELGDIEVEAFLNYLVLERHVSAQTQAPALSLLYEEVIKRSLSLQLDFVRSRKPRKLPVVLTRDEAAWAC